MSIQDRIDRSFGAQTMMSTLGARLLEVADGEVRIEMPFAEHLRQQQGYLHAGAITSIVDNACGYAALTKAPPQHEVVTAEFKVNFTRPAIGERFVATGIARTSGKRMAVCTGEVVAYAGDTAKVVAIMQATMVYVPL